MKCEQIAFADHMVGFRPRGETRFARAAKQRSCLPYLAVNDHQLTLAGKKVRYSVDECLTCQLSELGLLFENRERPRRGVSG